MPKYRYSFDPAVSLDEVEATLLLALWGTESLHGASQMRLDVGHILDRDRRACVIDAATPAGVDLNRLFVGFLQREFGTAFAVERLSPTEPMEARS